MPLTKREARAILACQRKICNAILVVRGQLKPQNLEYAEAYWLAHLVSIISGNSYGSMPISHAVDVLERGDE